MNVCTFTTCTHQIPDVSVEITYHKLHVYLYMYIKYIKNI